MERGIVTIIIIAFFIFFGYWLFNSSQGFAIRQNANLVNPAAPVYSTYTPNTYPTVYPGVNPYPAYQAYSRSYPNYTYPSTGSYITYPIAKSTGISYYSSPATHYTSTYYPADTYTPASYYNYTNSNANCGPYGCVGQNCFYAQDGMYICQ